MLRTVLNRQFFIATFGVAVVYLLLNVYFTNYSLINQSYFGPHDLRYKFQISLALLEGLFTAMSGWSLVVLVAMSFLTGANMVLVYRNLRLNLAKQRVHMVFGLSSLLGTAGSGCASCGLPLLGLLGISGSVGHLPFKGAEVSLIALGLLLFSFVVLLKKQLTPCLVNSTTRR
jgi:hypothetical protein